MNKGLMISGSAILFGRLLTSLTILAFIYKVSPLYSALLLFGLSTTFLAETVLKWQLGKLKEAQYNANTEVIVYNEAEGNV